jgi:hypothetical protein
MVTLLSLLSWTISWIVCPIYSWYELGWYYMPWSYQINICMNSSMDIAPVVSHEMGHLFWFEFLKMWMSGAEDYANWFSWYFMKGRWSRIKNLYLI